MSTNPAAIRMPKFFFRSLWVVVRVLLVVYLGQSGARFFYQGF